MLNQIADFAETALPVGLKRIIKRVVPSRYVYRAVRALTPDRVSRVTIRQGRLAGRQFECNLKYERSYWLGTHEPEMQQVLTQWLSPGSIFYDIGTHKAFFTLFAASLVGPRGRVVAFEPNPTNVQAASKNVALNADLGSMIQLCQLAVADRQDKLRFKGKEHRSTGRVVRDGSDEGTYVVDAVSLDEFVTDEGPHVIKMDIEGGERWALKGMERVLRECRPRLVIEVHDSESFVALSDMAGACNYHLKRLDGSNAPIGWRGREHWLALPSS